jgi:hypothetical protein
VSQRKPRGQVDDGEQHRAAERQREQPKEAGHQKVHDAGAYTRAEALAAQGKTPAVKESLLHLPLRLDDAPRGVIHDVGVAARRREIGGPQQLLLAVLERLRDPVLHARR